MNETSEQNNTTLLLPMLSLCLKIYVLTLGEDITLATENKERLC